MSIIEYIKERGGYVRAMDVESRAMYKQLLSEVTTEMVGGPFISKSRVEGLQTKIF